MHWGSTQLNALGFWRVQSRTLRREEVQGLQFVLVAQMIKNSPSMRKTQVRSLGQEDSLEEEMAAHSSILAWEIPQTEEPGWL